MPQITVKELIAKAPTISNLMGAKVEAHTAFKLRKFIKEAVEALEDVDKQRNALIKKYGEIIPDTGGQYRVRDENAEAFAAEWEKVQEEEVVLPNITITIRSLEKANLSVGDIVQLDFILDQDDAGEPSNIIPLGAK